jgi:Domain of unknown function (DUF4304)
MPESRFEEARKRILGDLAAYLNAWGFKAKSTSFNTAAHNRVSLVQAITLESGVRRFQGRFLVKLGVFFPLVEEVLRKQRLSFVHDYDCHVRASLGRLAYGEGGHWWYFEQPEAASADVIACMEKFGWRFFEDFKSAEATVERWRLGLANMFVENELIMAVLLTSLGEPVQARELLQAAKLSQSESVRGNTISQLAAKLGFEV